MYTDKNKKRIPAVLLILLAALAAALIWYFASTISAREI